MRHALSMIALGLLVTLGASAQDRVTFYKDVLPVLQENCQECHRPAGSNLGGMVAPMSLMTYQETRPWAKSIVKQIQSGKMPPWHADEAHAGQYSNERSLTKAEIALITDWVDLGAKRGQSTDAPAPKEFATTEGWNLGEPDLIVTMPEPFLVEDDVVDLYTAFEVDLTEEMLSEDVWITGFQCKPGSKVIHHFNCHLLYPDADGNLPPGRNSPVSDAISPVGAGQYIGGVASGTGANRYPEGFGLPLKKGTRVTFDIHYHKEAGEGTSAFDQSSIGFQLTRTPPTRQMKSAGPLSTFAINIPPGARQHKLGPVSQIFKQDSEIISFMPHMHMRGARAKFELFYPDGTSEVALHVPTYDFSWQTVYYLEEMMKVPEGTRIEFTAWYDNTPERAAEFGFDHNNTVRFGQASTDEMMMGFVMSAPVTSE